MESFFKLEIFLKKKTTVVNDGMVVVCVPPHLQALTSESMDRYVPPRGQAVSCLALLSSHLGTAVLDVPQNQQQQRNNNNNANPGGQSHHHRWCDNNVVGSCRLSGAPRSLPLLMFLTQNIFWFKFSLSLFLCVCVFVSLPQGKDWGLRVVSSRAARITILDLRNFIQAKQKFIALFILQLDHFKTF